MEKIPINWLYQQTYCEYQFYLEQVKGVEVGPTEDMLEGRKIHTALEDKHLEVAKLRLSVPEVIAKAKEEKIKLIGREVSVAGEVLKGWIDEVHFMPDQIRIIDDKPGNLGYLTDKIQVWGYCLAFEEHYKPNLPIIAVLRNRDSRKEFWCQPFEEQAKQEVLKSLNRIQEIISGQAKARPTSNINKCNACKAKAPCDAPKQTL